MGAVPPAQVKKNKKVKNLLMDGSVPSSVRFLVWSHLTDGKSKGLPGVYAQLGKRRRVSALADIERDVQRCSADHPHMHSSHAALMAVLQAYLTMVPDVEYSRGKSSSLPSFAELISVRINSHRWPLVGPLP
jgi:hypothetical protein